MKNSKSNQDGIVSIIITVILMIVITLIVLSFAKISRQEQRNALDRSLSTQAYYAAESGINDTISIINQWLSSNDSRLNDDYTDDCNAFADEAVTTDPDYTLPRNVAGSTTSSYTCVFVDATPPSLVYSPSSDDRIMQIEKENSSAINQLDINWDDGSGGTNFGGCPAPNTNPATWPISCDAPILRFELVDASNVTTSRTFFIYPRTAGANFDGTIATGSTASGECLAGNTPNKCRISITNLTGNKYYVRAKGLYKPLAISISAGGAELKNGQAVIDVTGKSSDVVRRTQVRIPLNGLNPKLPKFALEGADLCKRFSINGTTATDSGGCWGGGPPN